MLNALLLVLTVALPAPAAAVEPGAKPPVAAPARKRAAPPRPAVEPAETIEGQLTRAEVQRVIEAGPQRLVAAVRVSPHRVGSRFLGFRIDAFTPGGVLAENRALQAGDVLVAVNREPIERPEQFMRAWELAGKADTLEITLLRNDRRLLYRWKILP